MPKFFFTGVPEELLKLDGETSKHIARSLRMQKGDKLHLSDGEGRDFLAEICDIADCVTVRILSQEPTLSESSIDITVFQGIPKQGKMEIVIQKSVELGANRIVPVIMERCVAHPERSRLERWQRVAFEAAKQCGRSRIPQVMESLDFHDAARQLNEIHRRFVLYEEEAVGSLRDVVSGDYTQIGFMVGPEGGISAGEIELIRSLKIPTVTLGKRILRTETAAAAVIPIILYENKEI